MKLSMVCGVVIIIAFGVCSNYVIAFWVNVSIIGENATFKIQDPGFPSLKSFMQNYGVFGLVYVAEIMESQA